MANILILEDDPEEAFKFSTMLDEAGHDTVWCRTASEAYATYDIKIHDLIVADIFLQSGGERNPEGLMFIGQVALAELHDAGRTPIIAISGAGHDQYNPYVLENARGLGAKITLAKPVERDDFLQAVSSALKIKTT